MTHSQRTFGATSPTVLVTGGAGFIGCALSADLADSAGRVVAFDNLHPQVHERSERPEALDERVELVTGDVTRSEDWDALLDDVRPDIVVHLAAETGTGQSLAESTRHASVNVVGTSQMLDALNRRDALPHRIVLTSSRAVYGEGMWERVDSGERFHPGQRSNAMLAAGTWDFPGSEPTAMRAATTSPAPVSVYAATKLAQEHLLTVWAEAMGVTPVVLRLQNVYGPGQSLVNPYTGIMSLFCRMARSGTSIPLYEDGEVRRDFVLIDDVVDAVLAAATHPTAPQGPIDIGSGETQTIRTAAELIAARYGAPAPHVSGAFRHGDVRHAWADVRDAASELAWTPRYSLSDGVEQLASWIDAQPEVLPA